MTEPSICASEMPVGEPTPLVFPRAPDQGTLAALFESEESAILGFAIGLVGRRSVAEELVQEAFLRLHQHWDQVEQPKPWLYRTVRNLAINHLRDHAREAPPEETERPGDEFPPDAAVGRLEAIGMIRMLMAELPPDDRHLLHLKYHEDLKYQDISRKTGLSVSNVGYRLHHLLKGLADSLRHAGIDGSRG